MSWSYAARLNTADRDSEPHQNALLSPQPLRAILPRPCKRLPRGSHSNRHQQEDASLLPDRAHAPPRSRLLPRRGAQPSSKPTAHSSLTTSPDRSRPNRSLARIQRSSLLGRSPAATCEIRLPDPDPDRLRKRLDPTRIQNPHRPLSIPLPI